MKGNDYIRESENDGGRLRAKSTQMSRMNSLQTPKAMLDRLAQLRGIMFPNDCSPWEASRANPNNKRGRRPFRKRLPPLEEEGTGHNQEREGTRINTFYQAPIGEENFHVKHLRAISKPVNIETEVEVE